jgi:hypothetical protein
MHISHMESYFSQKTYQTVKLMKLLSYTFGGGHPLLHSSPARPSTLRDGFAVDYHALTTF